MEEVPFFKKSISFFLNKSIISISDMSKEDVLCVLSYAKICENLTEPLLKGKVIASLFFEPSTRTRLSFEAAANKLGARVISVTDVLASSAVKGETLSDTIRMVEGYVDCIILRHNLEGSARLASQVSSKPVINAGDGANQHPTQTLLDLYAIVKTQKKIDGLTIAIAGDLKYGRTAHSLAIALSLFDCTIICISPKGLEMPDYILQVLEKRKRKVICSESFQEHIAQLDILYMTRIQKERFVEEIEYQKIKSEYRLEKKHLVSVKPHLKILHPLPRVDEIHTDVDTTPYAHYFKQATDGLFVRQALLGLILGGFDEH